MKGRVLNGRIETGDDDVWEGIGLLADLCEILFYRSGRGGGESVRGNRDGRERKCL